MKLTSPLDHTHGTALRQPLQHICDVIWRLSAAVLPEGLPVDHPAVGREARQIAREGKPAGGSSGGPCSLQQTLGRINEVSLEGVAL